jgi:hypothetical protein
MKLPRRDLVHLTGKRAMLLSDQQATIAWFNLASRLEDMDRMDMPKFKHLLAAVRSSTIAVRSHEARIKSAHQSLSVPLDAPDGVGALQ